MYGNTVVKPGGMCIRFPEVSAECPVTRILSQSPGVRFWVGSGAPLLSSTKIAAVPGLLNGRVPYSGGALQTIARPTVVLVEPLRAGIAEQHPRHHLPVSEQEQPFASGSHEDCANTVSPSLR